MKLKLIVWKQKGPTDKGSFKTIEANNISHEMSFLEMLDFVNEDLMKKGEEPIEFDSDCREGICGTCGFMINGQAHGPWPGTTVCQLHMRAFKDGDSILIEPFRARAFPILKDLIVDRSALDRVTQAGGYTGAKTGPHPDANSILIPKEDADKAFDYATCIGCGACVASCPNASASLFTGAKVSHFALLPQGRANAKNRVLKMVDRMDAEGFGNCTNIGECQASCPKEISIEGIAMMKKEYRKALLS